jgi:hypothetical protein
MKPRNSAIPIYNKKDMIKKSGAFGDIPEKLLLDFLPRMYGRDAAIMHKWERYFESIGVPYAITKTTEDYKDDKGRLKTGYVFVLWKQLRV